jgi:hypothetical protein
MTVKGIVIMLQILQKRQCDINGNTTQSDFNFIRADIDSLSQVNLFFISYTI